MCPCTIGKKAVYENINLYRTISGNKLMAGKALEALIGEMLIMEFLPFQPEV